MSLFEDERYTWRETYFVLFQPERRPRLSSVRRELRNHAGTLEILEATAELDGRLRSMTVASYEDHAALEIVYHEGDAVKAEIDSLAETLETESSALEKKRLQKARNCRAKFDVLHFEQTAGTAAFKAVKRPEIRFSPLPHAQNMSQNRLKKVESETFSKEHDSDKLQAAKHVRFHFDPDCYENCVADVVETEFDDDFDDEGDNADDSSVYERIDPNTLVLVLDVLCRLSDGVAIDPAGGVVI